MSDVPTALQVPAELVLAALMNPLWMNAQHPEA
jgi:hypothetical protein